MNETTTIEPVYQQTVLAVQHHALHPTIALPDAIEAAILEGDIIKLKAEHRVAYYRSLCDSVGLNWMTRPFDVIKDDTGKYRPYARKEAAEQLRKLHRVSLRTIERAWLDDDLYCVTIEASTPDGRVEQSQGIVSVGKTTGQAKANALMRCETKAKRRATLAIVGLGWTFLEEETHRGQQIAFDPATGALAEAAPRRTLPAGTAPLGDLAASEAAHAEKSMSDLFPEPPAPRELTPPEALQDRIDQAMMQVESARARLDEDAGDALLPRLVDLEEVARKAQTALEEHPDNPEMQAKYVQMLQTLMQT